MSKPIVTIIGRPNVGKSSLFNRIVGRRVAVVHDFSGVTRDRNYMDANWAGQSFVVTDTGGLLPNSRDSLATEVNEQVDYAVAESTAIILLVDVQAGPTDLEELIARRLRREAHHKVIIAANKAESVRSVYDLGQFMKLGLGEPMAISALHGTGVGNLLDEVCKLISQQEPQEKLPPQPSKLSIAILGRPNAGKSSLVNKLLNQKRMIVSEVPGTTRDSIDTMMLYQEQPIMLIDTAGLRKKAQVKRDDVEYFSNLRALESIKRAHVCLLMVDAEAGFGEQDMKIVHKIREEHRGLVVCLNKWDIVEKDHKTFDHLVAELRFQYMELRNVPFVSLSALTGQRITAVLDVAKAVHTRMRSRISIKEFRQHLHDWSRQNPHPGISAKQIRILGGKQVSVDFPLFHIFATNCDLAQLGYTRYLLNQIYDTFDFEGCPVTIEYRPPARSGSRQTGAPSA
jgi:GTP-binding protein